MRLENILALTHGKLINEPFVNSFENIVFDASKVKRGDLFIAFDEDTIQTAILNGAYGIIFDKPTQISDSEIAWIKVLDIENALKRLLRFRIIEKEAIVYECNEIILKLALQIITEPNFIALNGDIKSISQTLWNIEDKSVVLFCPALCDRDIFTNVKKLPKTAFEPITIMEQTLFETSFIYNDIFYERQLISPFFIPYLESLLHLFKILKINYRLRKFTPINHFEAVFTNKKFEIKEFGTSDKVLIFEPNSSLIQSEITFLKKSANWANLIYVVPHPIDGFEDENIFIYENKTKIIDILKNTIFHFALIVGVDKSILSKPIANQTQLTLDF
jgi:ferrochelatase